MRLGLHEASSFRWFKPVALPEGGRRYQSDPGATSCVWGKLESGRCVCPSQPDGAIVADTSQSWSWSPSGCAGIECIACCRHL